MDSRIKPIHRRLIIDFIDNTPIPFDNKDLEWIAEAVEHKLQEKYDIKVANVDIIRK